MLLTATLAHPVPPVGGPARPEIGAYNHLTVAFALLRHDVEAEQLREDVLSNVTLHKLPDNLQQLYRELLRLADEVISYDRRRQAEEKQGQQRQAQENSAELLSYAGEVAMACTGVMVDGGLSCLVAAISPMFSGEIASNAQMPDIKFHSDLRAKVSEYEFRLSLARSRLLDGSNVEDAQLIRPGDIDQYLALRTGGSAKSATAYYQALASLHLRSPAMYFVAYELGLHAYEKGDHEAAARLFRSAVKHAPSGVRRSAVRADAKAYLGDLAVDAKDLEQALIYYSDSLHELPESLHAIKGKATVLHLLQRYDAALPFYEQWLQVAPDDAIGHYNYACALARHGDDVKQVLSQVANAFDAGFSDVEHAKRDPDLAIIHDSTEFHKLTAINLAFAPDWDAIDYDDLDITNRGAFALTNVRVLVRYRERNARGHLKAWASLPAKYEGSIKRFNRQQQLRFNAFNSNVPALAQLHVRVVSDQGAMSFLLTNRRGALIVDKVARLN